MPIKKRVLIFFALVATLGVAGTALSRGDTEAADPQISEVGAQARYGFEVVLTPAGPNRFRLLAAVRDLDSGDIVASPTMIFEAGKPARARSQITEREHTLEVSASVTKDLETAEIIFQTIERHRSLTFARTTVTLPKNDS